MAVPFHDNTFSWNCSLFDDWGRKVFQIPIGDFCLNSNSDSSYFPECSLDTAPIIRFSYRADGTWCEVNTRKGKTSDNIKCIELIAKQSKRKVIGNRQPETWLVFAVDGAHGSYKDLSWAQSVIHA